MGKRGPAKTPTVLTLLKGNPGKRAVNRREPKAPAVATLPDPPAWLDDHAQALWREIGPRLITSKVLSAVDLSAFALLCNSYSEFRQADEAITDHGGLTYESTTTTGALKITARPEVAIRADAYRRTLRMMQEFGLTASSRAGVHAEPSAPADPFADLLARRGAPRG